MSATACPALRQPVVPAAMPAKRFSLTDAQAKGNFTKRVRMEQDPNGQAALIAVARPWGSAFWVFEGRTSGRNNHGSRRDCVCIIITGVCTHACMKNYTCSLQSFSSYL